MRSRGQADARLGRALLVLGALAMAGVALFERFRRLPTLPFADPDAWGYIRPAVLLFTQGEYVHTGSREFVYPLFVHGLLRISDSWAAVPAVQHVLGVAGGLVLLAAWMRLPLPAGAPRALRAARGVLGLGLVSAHLFLAQTLTYEHLLRPEALSQPVLALLLFGLAGLVGIPRDDPRRDRRLVADGTLLVACAGLLVALRPQTLLVLPACVGLVALVALRLRPGRRVAAAALALPLLLCTLGLWIPERVLAQYDPRSGRFMSGVLFFWHFDLVDDVLREDLAGGRLSPSDVGTVRDLFDAFEAEKARHAREGKWYHFQDYNPDALYYGRAGKILDAHFGEDSEAYERFALSAFRRAVLEDPWGYLRKIGVNLANYYAWPGGRVLNARADLNVPRSVRESVTSFAPYAEEMRAHPATRRYLDALAADAERRGHPEDPRTWVLGFKRLGKALRQVHEAIDALHVPLLLAALALLAFPAKQRDGPLAAAVFAAAGLALAANLTSSAVHGLETMRYVFGITILSLFTEAAAALFLGVRVLGLARVGRRPRG